MSAAVGARTASNGSAERARTKRRRAVICRSTKGRAVNILQRKFPSIAPLAATSLTKGATSSTSHPSAAAIDSASAASSSTTMACNSCMWLTGR